MNFLMKMEEFLPLLILLRWMKRQITTQTVWDTSGLGLAYPVSTSFFFSFFFFFLLFFERLMLLFLYFIFFIFFLWFYTFFFNLPLNINIKIRILWRWYESIKKENRAYIFILTFKKLLMTFFF